MAEVRAENIKRDPLAGGVGRVGKGKLRLRIAEALDGPGGGDAVDMGSRARDPRAAAGRQRRSVTPAPRAWPRLRGAQTLGRRLPQTASALPGRRLQVIDGLDAVQLTLQAIEPAAELRDRSAVVRLIAIEVPEDVPAALHHRLELDAPSFVEEAGDLFFSHRFDPIDAQQRCLTAERLNFLHEPLEQLRGLRSFGQDPAGAPQPDGAHPLELAPDADAVPGRRARQARSSVSQRIEPTVTLATRSVKDYTP